MKLSERLDEHPMIEYYDRNGELCGKSYSHALSNSQMLKCCVRTIHSQPSTGEGKHSKILVVGTHRDLESTCSETRVEKNMKLVDMLMPQDELVLYSPHLNDPEVIFPINAKTPAEQDHQVCALIRMQVQDKKYAPSPYKIPIGWFLLEQDIIKASKGGVISKTACLGIASILNIDAEALTAALKYFDELNIFLYYPSVLPEVVFSDPQILLNKVTELVHFSYSLQSDNPPLAVEGKWLQFRDKGIVTVDMFQDDRFSAHYILDLFTPADLIRLFEHLLIVAPLSSTQYFMPSLLHMISPKEISKHLPLPSSSVAPLLVYFPAGCAQNGIFCALVVYLLSECHWKFAKRASECVSRSCVCFQIPNAPVSIALVDCFSFFKVSVEAPDPMYPKVCPKIQEAIFSGVEAAARALKYSNSKPKPAFLCSKCSSESPPHAATPVIDDEHCYLMCTKSTNYGPLKKQHAVWLDVRLPVDPPKVIQHPNSQTVPTGAQTTFTVEATGDDLIFQWQKNGCDTHNDSNYSGTDTNTLSIRHVNKNDGGHYRCLVKNEVKRDGEVSEEAKLRVFDPPKVTQCPKSQSVSTGAKTTFKIEATGDDLIFQWQKNGSDVHNDSNYSGSDTNTLSIRHVGKSDGGHYRCLVKNEVKNDGDVSEEAKLTVVNPPIFTEHPKSQSVPTGGEKTFKVEARGDDLTFQWQKNGTNLKNDSNYSGTDTDRLRIEQVKKSHEGCYRCLVRNEIGILSEEAQLSVYDRWNPLKVACGILIVVVVIAFIVMLWWLPGNGDGVAVLNQPTVQSNTKLPGSTFHSASCHSISSKQELEKAVAEIGNWEAMCERLGVHKAVLNGLRNIIDTDGTIKKSRCLEAYLNIGNACWEQVVKVIADYPFYNLKLAKEIAAAHGIDYSRIEL